MTQNPAFVTTKFSWIAVAAEVSKLAGRTYSAQYIREVATGWRSNKKLKPILEKLGVLNLKAA